MKRLVRAGKFVASVVVVSVVLGIVTVRPWHEYAAALAGFVSSVVLALRLRLPERQRDLQERALERGHQGPFLPTVTFLMLLLGWLGGLSILPLLGPPDTPTAWVLFALLVPAWMVLCDLVAAGLSAALVAVAPRRPVRRAGARQVCFPWRAWAILLLVAGGALCALWLVQGRPLLDAVRFPIFGLCLFLTAWAYAKRAHARTFERARAEDPRPPVLYLRAFASESEPFVDLPGGAWGYVPDEEHHPTFEQYFRPAVEGRIGPLIALGNPTDYVPPLGAARAYVPDESWQDTVQRLAEESSCMLAQCGHSGNLAWEFVRLRELGLHRKLFVLTPPAAAADWVKTVDALHAAGYVVDLPTPGPGSVIAFDKSGRALAVARSARTADEYVAAIALFLNADAAARGVQAGH